MTDPSKIARAMAEADEAIAPLDAALAYAKADLPVFPCNAQDKKPLTPRGFKDATTEAKQLRNWWGKWPDAMIGLPCGPESGVFVVDVDVDPDENVDGFAPLAELEKQHGKLQGTLASITPRGGSHIFFPWRNGIKNSAGKLGVGLDVRGAGGYVILPPSRRSDGRVYEWATSSAAEPCDPPAWLIDKIIAPKEKPAAATQSTKNNSNIKDDAYARTALEDECAAVAKARSGTRNETLYHAARCLFQLVAGGALSEGEVNDRLYSAARSCGLDRDDGDKAVRDTVASGATAGRQKPRSIPEPRARHGNSNGGNHVDAKQDDTSENSPRESPRLKFCDIAAWANSEPPPREWAVLDRFPLRNVALLSGEGSIGKTILLLQQCAAHVLAKDWIGTLPEPGPALYFNAEDEDAEIHRRLADIAAHYGAALTDLKDQLHILALAGQDALLGYPDRRGVVRPTPLFARLKEAACDIQPKLIGLDTSADIFGGNENDRSQVRQFIGLLRGLAISANASVIVAAHPSLTGINSGSGLSGSTGWHNSVRARAYLHAVNAADGAEPDLTLRRLDFMKSNYSAPAESIALRWRNGVFVPEPKAGSFEKLAADAKVDDLFLKLLDRFSQQGRIVGDRKGVSYAPAQFAAEPEAKAATASKERLADAMRRLFATNKIHVESYGRKSNQHHRLASGPPQ